MYVCTWQSAPAARPDIHLYWASGSPPCWRVMLALEEKGITDYTSTLCSMDKDEHKSPEVLKINPRGQVKDIHSPLLRINPVTLSLY